MFRPDDNNTAPLVSKARSALAMVTELIPIFLLMPAGFAHDAAPNFTFAAFIFFLAAITSGHSNPNDGVRHNMPAHIGARYDAGAWAAGIISFLLLNITGATVMQGFFTLMVWVGLTYLHGRHLDSIYGNDAVWARNNPEQAARIAADKARADEAYKQTQEYKDWELFKFFMFFLVTTFSIFVIAITSKKPVAA